MMKYRGACGNKDCREYGAVKVLEFPVRNRVRYVSPVFCDVCDWAIMVNRTRDLRDFEDQVVGPIKSYVKCLTHDEPWEVGLETCANATDDQPCTAAPI